jgi:threonine-phosphate decarboxylase
MKDIHGGNIWEASREAGIRCEDIMDFSASINPLGLSPRAASAIKKSLRLISPYPDPASSSIVEALSAYHGVSPNGILPGNGSTEFIHLLPAILKPASALIVEPAFSEYRNALRDNGCRVDSFVLKEENGFLIDAGRLKSRLNKGYDLVYIANPANPTGAITGKEVILDVAQSCEKLNSTLVVDEAFVDFCEDRSIKTEAVSLKNVVVLRSMTKFFSMAGLRLGYVISNANTIKRLAKRVPPWSVNTLAAAAAESVRDGRYIRKVNGWLEMEKDFVFQGLGSIKGLKAFESSANFLMVKITDGSLTAPKLKSILFEKGILIRDLSSFRGLGPRFFRIAIKKRRENEILIRALKSVFGKRR